MESVNAAEAVEPVALNVWSQVEMPSPSVRSVQPAGGVYVGSESPMQVACITHLAVERVTASHVEVVPEARWSASVLPIGFVWCAL